MSAAKRKYKPYPKYKDSGVEWLGQVPEHWDSSKVKFIGSVQLGKMLQPEAKREGDVLVNYIRASTLQWSGLNLGDVKQMWASPREILHYDLRKGDLLISEGGDVGRSWLLREDIPDFIFQNSINRVRSSGEDDGRFLSYWFQMVKHNGWIDILCNRSTIGHYTAEKVADTEMLEPPPTEQTAVADFIERECGRMDKLVEKKQEFITLLKEKRQALITHAVTKGLDPKAAMKDSGVEWLGKVPKHWDVKRLKYLVSLGRDKTSESIEGKTFVGLEDVPSCEGRYAPTSNESRITETGTVNLFCRGSVLYGKLRPYLCKVMIADFDGACSTEFLVLNPNDSVRASWIRNWLLTPELTQQIESGCEGAKMPRADWDHVGGLPLPCPTDPAEADAIADHIDRETTRIDRLIAKTLESIDLLKERKTALITAAVTGQIDVSQSA